MPTPDEAETPDEEMLQAFARVGSPVPDRGRVYVTLGDGEGTYLSWIPLPQTLDLVRFRGVPRGFVARTVMVTLGGVFSSFNLPEELEGNGGDINLLDLTYLRTRAHFNANKEGGEDSG